VQWLAPWTSRILSPNSRNNLNNEASPAGSPSTASGLNSVSPIKSRARITEADILENAYGIPTLQVPTGRNGKKNSHGRYVTVQDAIPAFIAWAASYK